MPPQITIDPRAPIPAFRQVVDQLRHLLVTGALKPGDPLPSVRRLAIDLGLNHNTIAEAYRTLAAEGWLDLAQGRSVRVRERADEPAPTRSEQKELRASFHRRLQHLVAEMRAQGLSPDWIAKQLEDLSREELA
jgi:DNA-binding transcriptional regulator YhcF (GntR family)